MEQMTYFATFQQPTQPMTYLKIHNTANEIQSIFQFKINKSTSSSPQIKNASNSLAKR